MSPVATQLGQLIRDARHRSGLTLEDVAEKVGVTPGALSHIESGRRLPNPSNAVAIAEILGVPTEEILQALDAEHSQRRRNSVDRELHQSLDLESQPPSTRKPSRLYSVRPVEELFGENPAQNAEPEFPPTRSRPSAAPSPSMRQMARWSADTAERLAALEQLSDTAADAIRTLRGLLDDEDPAVSREARRLLRELDVRLPER